MKTIKEVIHDFDSRIKEAEKVQDENLKQRLTQFKDEFIQKYKKGEIQKRSLLRAFLVELENHAQVYLEIQKNEISFEDLTAVEQYWYGTLFPRWLQQDDPKFETWKQKIKQEDIPPDEEIIRAIAKDIYKNKKGNFLHSYIADLAMATDLIVSSYYKQKSLCIQLTTLNEQYQENKYNEWQKTLKYWHIFRGLFLSYNPSKMEYLPTRLANIALFQSNYCPDHEYKLYKDD